MFPPRLWELLHASSSNIAQRVVPLLLHCTCLPYGAEQLCFEVEKNFINDDWKVRSTAGRIQSMFVEYF